MIAHNSLNTRKTPDFIIIGAQKCGTSTFFHHLRKHPDIRLPFRKELHYFDEHFSNGIDWYLRFFEKPRAQGKPYCTGEASPYYFFHPRVPERIFSVYPRIKLLLLLRNPVNRAYSQYQHMKRKGRISLSFEHCIHLESEILDGRKEEFMQEEGHTDLIYRRFSFLARSRYSEQLSEWFKYFPREQIMIIRSEDYFSDPAAVYSGFFHFLGLSDFRIMPRKEHIPGDYEPIGRETRLKLNAYFEPYNQKLAELTGRDFCWDE